MGHRRAERGSEAASLDAVVGQPLEATSKSGGEWNNSTREKSSLSWMLDQVFESTTFWQGCARATRSPLRLP